VLTVRGQALVDRRCPATVAIEVDGTPVGLARLRLPTFGPEATNPRAVFAGFEHAIVVDGEQATTIHTIDAVVTGTTGARFRVGERTVQVTRRRTTEPEARDAALLRARTQAAVNAAAPSALPPLRDGRYRLLVFTHQLDLGGAQLYLQELLRQLTPILESCTVVSPSDGELRGELERLGIDVIVTGMGPPADMATYEGQVRERSMLILDSACQVVLVNTLGDIAAVDAAARLGVPSVWAIHESFEVDYWLEMRFGRGGPQPCVGERMKANLGAASRLVFVAQSTSDMFARYADQERRLVIPYGVDIDGMTDYMSGFDRATARKRHGLQPDTTVLLCVGTVEERKSQACLVEAFADVAAAHPDATLVLVGDRPGAYSSSLHRLIESMNLGRRIRLLPLVPERQVWEWYALSDVLVSAADIESLPRTMLEAMAFGLPVLAANVFGIPEIIRDGEDGWLFEARDMQALVAAMHHVLDLDTETREAFGQAARTLAHERFRSTNYGRTYAELLRELASVPMGSERQPLQPPRGPRDQIGNTGPSRDIEEAAARTWEVVRPYTMTSPQRVAALCDAVRYICAHGIRGDIVECGVWRGGSMLAAARTLLECGDDERTLWLYDTFSGMTPPDDVDRRLDDRARAADLLAGSTRGADIWAVADLEEVKRTMSLCAYPEDKIRYVAGPIERTLPETSPREVALLHLDTDWYASTRHELVHLFPRLSASGVLIVDDYGYWEGQRKAVDEYLASIDTPVFLARIDQAARIAVVP
jgi:glycosyltransferase involved in cell wall biosynthesis